MVIEHPASVITTTQQVRASVSLIREPQSVWAVSDVSRSISIAFPESENDAADAAIIEARRYESTEPLEDVLGELDL